MRMFIMGVVVSTMGFLSLQNYYLKKNLAKVYKENRELVKRTM